MRQYEYVIGTGWWCAETEPPVKGRRYLGSDLIRSAEFHHLWSAAIDGWTDPSAVFIVDSASKQKPPIKNARYQLLSLMNNPGHAVVHSGHYSGWMASVIHSIEYALSNEVDYLVYIEQDALIYGDGIIEYCIGKMRKPLMFGSGEGTPQLIQQSFFVIRNDAMRRFLAGLHAISRKDKVISPEWKFVLSSLGLRGRLVERVFAHERLRAGVQRFLGELIQSVGYDLLPVGVGRSRPIDFDLEHFYFQHGSIPELREYMRRLPPAILRSVTLRSRELANILTETEGEQQVSVGN